MRISDWSADVCSYDLEREEVPAVLEKQAVSALGDLWEMNGHRLICGDALDGRIYDQLMEGEKAHAVFTDQPYGCGIDGFVAGKGRQRELIMGSGVMSDDELLRFFVWVTQALVELLGDVKRDVVGRRGS